MPGRRASAEERREQLLDAAARVAHEHRVDGMTARRVAATAGVSTGTVFVYYPTMDDLMLALLDATIARVVPTELPAAMAGEGSARDRLLTGLASELTRLSRVAADLELFLDFWVIGTRHAEVRRRIRAALDGYRRLLEPALGEVVTEEAERFSAVEPERLAAVVASFVHGNAVQALMDPDGFDVAGSMVALEALIPGPDGT